jgi:Na+-driven multidrug efflux pump
MAAAVMLVLTLLCHIAPDAMIRVFNRDPAVVAFGSEYLRIISWNFVASGVVFVSSSVFQGMGNTLPPLGSSLTRLLLFAVPAYTLARQPGFQMRHVWYVSLASVGVQTCVNLWLLRREFDRKLGFPPLPAPAALAAPS